MSIRIKVVYMKNHILFQDNAAEGIDNEKRI